MVYAEVIDARMCRKGGKVSDNSTLKDFSDQQSISKL